MRVCILAISSMFAVIPACSGKEAKHPPDLGGCVPKGDVGCTPPVAGGSNGATPTVDDSGASGSGAEASTSCGVAGLAIMTNNIYCTQCITASCCMADQLCPAACVSLLQCTQTCLSGDTTCVMNCESLSPLGLQPYQDLANCISSNCIPQCPVLQQ